MGQLLVFYKSIHQTIVLKVCPVEEKSFWVAFIWNFYNFGCSKAKYIERHSVVAKNIEFIEIT
jgi:hypothetical protein